jgi:hypothetical protein
VTKPACRRRMLALGGDSAAFVIFIFGDCNIERR